MNLNTQRQKVIERPESPKEQPTEVMEATVKIEDFLDETMVDTSEPSREDSSVPVTEAMDVVTKQESSEQPPVNDTSADKPIKIESEDVTMSNPLSADQSKTPVMGTPAPEAADNKALVPKLKENAKDDFMMMPPPLAPAVIQKCRPSILELDTSVTMFSLDNLEALMEGTRIGSLDINALFPDLPLYGPPNPDDNDAYLDEAEHGRVTMISRLMSSKPPQLDFSPLASQVVYLKHKRDPTEEMDDFEEEDARVPKIEGRILNAIPGTEPPRTVPVLFQTKKNKDAPSTPIRRPTPPGPLAQKVSVVWTSEEDDLLLSMIKPYQYNWDLISDMFNSMRGPILSSERRTPYDCYDRWSKKDGPQSGPNGVGADSGSGLIPIGNLPTGSTSTPPSPKARKDKDGKKIVTSIKADPAKKKQRSLSMLEAMKKAMKKREIAQSRVNAGMCFFRFDHLDPVEYLYGLISNSLVMTLLHRS